MKTDVATDTTFDLPTLPAKTLEMPELTVVETERDTFAKNRSTIMAALRENGDKQIKSEIFDGHGGFCFVGCAVEALGKPV